jgi:putative transposase
VLQVSRSGYYAWAARPPRAPARRRQDRLARLRTVDAETAGRYGSPQITAVLPRAGDRITGQTEVRLMRQVGLRARVTRRYKATTSSGHGWPVTDNVRARPCTATQPPATGRADISDVATDEGGRYLARLEDRATRPIVGGAVDARMTQDLVICEITGPSEFGSHLLESRRGHLI